MIKTANSIIRFAIAGLIVSLTAKVAMAGPGDGTVLGATKIDDNGPNSLRFNIVVLAEGFTSSQQDLFNSYAQQVVDEIHTRPQLQPYIAAINVIRLNVASNQAGADDPLACGGTGVYVNTYFDATFCGGGIRRALVANNGLCILTLNTWVPEWDQAVLLVNSPVYGGTGGQISVFSVVSGWREVFVHELGHSAFGLGDEYEYYAGCGAETDHDYHPLSEPSVPNATIQTNRALIKWRDLILPTTPVPTTVNANCAECDPQGNPLPAATIGLYEGADYYHCRAYRPRFNCLMRALGYDWCPVCYRELDAVLAPYMATHVDLSIQSANPSSGVAIIVSPSDTSQLGNGSTPFVRTYTRPSTVTLQAPAVAGGNSFSRWRRDGVDDSAQQSLNVYFDRNTIMSAVYLQCTDSVQPPSIDLPSPLCVGTVYCVTWRRLPGASSYEIRENTGNWESTAADTFRCFSHPNPVTYTYEVRPISACGTGASSVPVPMTLESVPAPNPPEQPVTQPADLICISRPYTLRWDPVPGATAYEVRQNGGEWVSTGATTLWSYLQQIAGSYTHEVRARNICGVSNPSSPVTIDVAPCFDLIVFSQHPSDGVTVTMTPVDQNGQGSASTPFVRMYAAGTSVTMQTPAVVNTRNFHKWQRDGADYSILPSVSFTFDTTHTMTAIYQAPVLSIGSVNPASGVPVVMIPADVNEQADGSTPFTRTYEVGTGVTLQAPATVNGNPFQKWQVDGSDHPGGQSMSITVDNDYSIVAFYRSIAGIQVESKSVSLGPGLVPIHIKLSNDVAVRKIILPLEIRTVTGGAFITSVRIAYAERLASYLTGLNSASRFPDANGNCKSGQPGGYGTMTTILSPNVDYPVTASPEGISLIRGRVSDPALPIGADTAGSIVLSVALSGIGSFEIDTTCTNPANHLVFTQEDPPSYTSIVPTFTKGTITVTPGSCNCPMQGDINSDTAIDVFDVIGVIGIAFTGDPDPQDPACPKTRSDVNNDGVTDVFDVIYLIATAFSGGPNPVDPCVP